MTAPRSWQGLAWWLGATFLAANLVIMPRLGDPADIDCAWQALLQLGWNTGLRSGVESVFTYGPMGYLLSQSSFVPAGLWSRTLLGYLLAAALAASMLAVGRLLPARWRAAWLPVLVLVAPVLQPAAMFLGMTALGVVAARRIADAESSRPLLGRERALLAGAMLLYAILALAKFTYFALAAALVVALGAVAFAAGRRRLALALASGYAGAVVAVWLWCRQPLADLPVWLRGAGEIARGYNDSMGTVGDDDSMHWGIVTVAGLGALAAALHLQARGERRARTDGATRAREMVWLGCLGVVCAGLAASWKAGFVRHDASHDVMFFGVALAMPFLFVAATGVRTLPRGVGLLAFGLVVLAGWQEWVAGERIRKVGAVPAALARLGAALRPATTIATIERQMAQRLLQPRLPRLRALVGAEPVDFMGYEQGAMFADGFAVRNRPVFQSYSAYTPYLQQINGVFFQAEHAPRFVLAKVQALSGRLPMTEDSAAWLELLWRYHPVAAERGVLLVERDRAAPDAAQGAAGGVVTERRAALDEWVELPADDDWHTLGIDVDYSALGRATMAVLRPARLFLDVRTRAGQEFGFAAGAELVRSPFLVDPLVVDTLAFVRAATGGPVERVAAFRLRTSAGDAAHFGADYGVRIESRTAPDHAREYASAAEPRALATAFEFPFFEWLPIAVSAPERVRRVGMGELGVFAPPPCRLSFRWPGGRHTLAATFALHRTAWSGAVQTQGATFRIEVAGADGGAAETVFARTLTPATVATDRGDQTANVVLTLTEGRIVDLVTDVGPDGSDRYDFAVWRDVALDPR